MKEVEGIAAISDDKTVPVNDCSSIISSSVRQPFPSHFYIEGNFSLAAPGDGW